MRQLREGKTPGPGNSTEVPKAGPSDESVKLGPISHSVLRVVAAAFLFAAPAPLWAQLCLGSPLEAGQLGFGASAGFSEGASSYALEAGYSVPGPVAIGAYIGSIDYDDVDKNAVQYGGRLIYELPVEGFGACPTVGFGGYFWTNWIEGVSVDLSGFSVPVGLSVGGRVGEQGSSALLPFASAGFLYYRDSLDAREANRRLQDTMTDSAFFVSAGATVSLAQLFLSGGVSKTTIEDSNVVVTLGLGVHF